MFLHVTSQRVVGGNLYARHSRLLVAVTDSCAFTLLKFTLTRPNEVNVNLDVLADELFAQEFAGFVGIMRLSWVRLPIKRVRLSSDFRVIERVLGSPC